MTAESSSLMCCSRSRDTWLAAAARCSGGCNESHRLSQLYHGRVGGSCWNECETLRFRCSVRFDVNAALGLPCEPAAQQPRPILPPHRLDQILVFPNNVYSTCVYRPPFVDPFFVQASFRGLSIRSAVSLISRWACNMITWPSLVSYEAWTSFSSKIRQSRQHKRLASARPSMLQRPYTVQVFSPCTHTGANPEVWVLHLHSSTWREGLQPVESCHCHS